MSDSERINDMTQALQTASDTINRLWIENRELHKRLGDPLVPPMDGVLEFRGCDGRWV